MVVHASVATNKPTVELDSHADTCVVGDNYLVINDHNRSVSVYSYNPKGGHRSTKMVDATVGYQDPKKSHKLFLIIKQTICINGLENHLS